MSIPTRCRSTYYAHTYQVPIDLVCPYLPGADLLTKYGHTRCRSTYYEGACQVARSSGAKCSRGR
eukprot:scaffold18434_cov34-Phaeocystis_antarctica.AAC.3